MPPSTEHGSAQIAELNENSYRTTIAAVASRLKLGREFCGVRLRLHL
jgi:hypothetical protein